jgi:hypothetical protein
VSGLGHFRGTCEFCKREVLTGDRAAFRVRGWDDELVERMDHEGVRTFHGDGFTIEVGKPTEREWNLDLLLETLDRLVSDGIISSRKAEKCVKIEQKVVAMEVRPLESDPRTQRQIAACYREVPARRSVKVRA